MKRPTKTGIERDVVDARNRLKWQRGEVAKVKRQMNRRDRHEARQDLRHAC